MTSISGQPPVAPTQTNHIDDLLMKLALSGADAKTLMLAREILDCDGMISDNLNQIHDLNELRDAYAGRKQELSLVKSFEKANPGGPAKNPEKWAEFLDNNPTLADKYDLRPVPSASDWGPGMEEPQLKDYDGESAEGQLDEAGYAKAMEEWNTAVEGSYGHKVEKLYGKQSFSSDGGKITTHTEGGVPMGNDDTADLLDAEIQNQDTAIQKLDQAKELINIRNQQALQRKQRTLTLVSNFNQADHEGQKAVISNTRA